MEIKREGEALLIVEDAKRRCGSRCVEKGNEGSKLVLAHQHRGVPYVGKFDELRTWTPCTHGERGLARQKIGLCASQNERRTLDCVPHGPERCIACRVRSEGHGDTGIVLQLPSSVGQGTRGAARERFPLRAGQRPEWRGNGANMRFEGVETVENQVES